MAWRAMNANVSLRSNRLIGVPGRRPGSSADMVKCSIRVKNLAG